MPQAKAAILACHALAREWDSPEDIALCHAVGQGCSVVHTAGHAMGYPIYESDRPGAAPLARDRCRAAVGHAGCRSILGLHFFPHSAGSLAGTGRGAGRRSCAARWCDLAGAGLGRGVHRASTVPRPAADKGGLPVQKFVAHPQGAVGHQRAVVQGVEQAGGGVMVPPPPPPQAEQGQGARGIRREGAAVPLQTAVVRGEPAPAGRRGYVSGRERPGCGGWPGRDPAAPPGRRR